MHVLQEGVKETSSLPLADDLGLANRRGTLRR